MTYLPVKGYEGLYEVSDQGTVRSVDRKVLGKDGATYPFKGRTLKAHPHKDVEYLQISLWKHGKGTHYYVHRLVAQAHISNPSNLPEVNHLDGNRVCNTVNNLEWVTGQQNKQHAISTGLKVYTNRLTKMEFFECLQSVIAGESYHSLSQRVPYKVPFLSTKLRKLAQELELEHELNASLMEQRIQRARINGVKNIPQY